MDTHATPLRDASPGRQPERVSRLRRDAGYRSDACADVGRRVSSGFFPLARTMNVSRNAEARMLFAAVISAAVPHRVCGDFRVLITVTLERAMQLDDGACAVRELGVDARRCAYSVHADNEMGMDATFLPPNGRGRN